jgi:hypothetical protein
LSSEKQYFPIQADPLRAPEVLLAAGWLYEADMWSIGVLVTIHADLEGIYSYSCHARL